MYPAGSLLQILRKFPELSVFAVLTDGPGCATIIYQFDLMLDGECLASRYLRVYQRETEG